MAWTVLAYTGEPKVELRVIVREAGTEALYTAHWLNGKMDGHARPVPMPDRQDGNEQDRFVTAAIANWGYLRLQPFTVEELKQVPAAVARARAE